MNELQEIAPTLAKLDKVNFYQVPEGYFSDSIKAINSSLEYTEPISKVLDVLRKKKLYRAPVASYFEAFSDHLIHEIHTEEVGEELSYVLPILQQLPKKESFEIPTDYFTTLPDLITQTALRAIAEHPKQISQWRSVWAELTDWVMEHLARPKYTFTLASVISMIVCIGLVINAQTLSTEDKTFAEMQQLSDADLHHYFDKHIDDFDEHTILHNLNNVEFSRSFESTPSTTPINPKEGTDEQVVNDMLD